MSQGGINGAFSEQILAEKLSKLNSTQQCIQTLSYWCIFHRSKAEQVVATWDKQFHSSEMIQKVPLLYLANDILQNSKRNGNEFVSEFWKVLPPALKEVVKTGDDRGKNVISRLVNIWEERRVFGSHTQSLKDVMLGEELPPPLNLGKKRSRSVRIVKRDSKSIRTKLTIGGTAEKIVSAFNLVLSEHPTEDEEMNKCKSAVQRVRKMGNDVDVALTKTNDPSRKTLAKELDEEEQLLYQCIEKLKVVEANRMALLSQLREALHEQESELEIVRTQMQVAQAQAEEAANMRKHLNDEHVVHSKPSTASADTNAKPAQTTKKSAAAIAAEVADKLAASSSSQYIMTSVLSTFAAEEAKNAELMKSSTASNSFSSMFNSSMPNQVSDQTVFMAAHQLNPPQNNAYQTVMVPQPTMQVQISNAQPQYHSLPNPPQHYLQPSGGFVGSYDYSNLPPLPPGPPPPAPPPYVMSPMVPLTHQPMQMTQQQPLMMGHQPSMLSQQQTVLLPQPPPAPPSSRPPAPFQAPPGIVHYHHSYQSQ